MTSTRGLRGGLRGCDERVDRVAGGVQEGFDWVLVGWGEEDGVGIDGGSDGGAGQRELDKSGNSTNEPHLDAGRAQC
jgi:hypothetical protein